MFKKTLAATASAVAATAVLGSLATGDVKRGWYASLDKPVIQPPPVVFPIVWTALYTDLAVTSAVVIDRLRSTAPEVARAYQRALALNLVVNASFSWVFFKAHQLAPAIVVAGLLAASTADLARRAAAVQPAAGIALTPYAVWCSFASVLSTAIWRRNR